jgi:hypothetical protein
MSMAGLAGLAAAQGQPTRALRLIGAATALDEAVGQQNSVAWHAMVEGGWSRPDGR